MNIKKLTLAAIAAATGAAMAAMPEVSNVTMTQAANRRVTVTYRLSNVPAIVTLDIQTNANTSAAADDPGWTSIGGRNICNAQGDVWKKVSGKDTYTITWQPDQVWTDAEGEGFKIDANGDEDFQSVMKEIRKKDYAIESCCYQVFDVLTYDEFRLGKTRKNFSQRLDLLYKLNAAYEEHPHGDCWVKPLKQERLTCQADFDRWAGYVEAGNWEGFMLRKDVPYQSGRTKDLLKCKKFFDVEYTVEGVEVGEMSTAMPGQGIVKYQGVTRLVIDHKGNKVGVGSGMSREQRIAWMENPKLIVGKTVTIKFFEITKNQQGGESLRFPTLKCVYEEGRDV